MGAQDGSKGTFTALGAVQASGDKDSGQALKRNILDCVAIIAAFVHRDRIKGTLFWQRVKLGTTKDAPANAPGAGLPLVEDGTGFGEFFKLFSCILFSLIVPLAKAGLRNLVGLCAST
jgi:hypothetical protein